MLRLETHVDAAICDRDVCTFGQSLVNRADLVNKLTSVSQAEYLSLGVFDVKSGEGTYCKSASFTTPGLALSNQVVMLSDPVIMCVWVYNHGDRNTLDSGRLHKIQVAYGVMNQPFGDLPHIFLVFPVSSLIYERRSPDLFWTFRFFGHYFNFLGLAFVLLHHFFLLWLSLLVGNFFLFNLTHFAK